MSVFNNWNCIIIFHISYNLNGNYMGYVGLEYSERL